MQENDKTHSAIDETAALRSIVEGTASETGTAFFRALVKNVAAALRMHGSWVTTYDAEAARLSSLAFWLGDHFVDEYAYDITGTPCQPVIDRARLVHIPENVIALFPHDPDLPALNAVSYMGVPLLDTDGRILGHLAVLDTKPMPEEPRAHAIFQIFANRAAAELRRLRAETEIREREERLSRLVGSAMDAIIEIDIGLLIARFNPAAERLFACASGQAVGQSFERFLSADCADKLRNLMSELDRMPEGEQYLWIPGGFRARPVAGDEFPAEATLSRYETQKRQCYTIILRSVNERLEAEARIATLQTQTEYLKEELRSLRGFDGLIGQSPALVSVVRDVEQVAPTDATVLIFGETGTGKEVIARAVHAASARRDRALIKVNCAAIPSTLIESEFFGHTAGAFTGATGKRDGRFTLADGGTIFLDEVGELPLDLQGKLLRVLQEGEFEPVGSSATQTVDVRVLAATNRDLKKAVAEGKFREDLYYRLHVFPLEVPPLRQRLGDIPLLAAAFAERFARQLGRPVPVLTDSCVARLQAYDWPGNVRELQNVIERAVITSRDTRLNLERALPVTPGRSGPEPETPDHDNRASLIYTSDELEQLERENIVRALQLCEWKVSGDGGAAARLGMKPTTLASRMKALGIARPT